MSDGWTFLTNHAHVLLAIAHDPSLRLRDIAELVGVTERTAVGIVSDLEREGYVQREKVGRRNHYVLNPERPLRHPLEAHHEVGELLAAIEHGFPSRASS
jgi:predicted DNA-binding transcriptional regulator